MFGIYQSYIKKMLCLQVFVETLFFFISAITSFSYVYVVHIHACVVATIRNRLHTKTAASHFFLLKNILVSFRAEKSAVDGIGDR